MGFFLQIKVLHTLCDPLMGRDPPETLIYRI